ncbi:unnamed protein product [Paramecium primaurelia]|uniref:Protein arginine N-methyltransferase domain-containing protein n=2 Tax=Paramecium TaxID=5884 RepID=A0A8S1XCQ0_9CILI|nr:unnamed protein product [Paramecium primaurelia]CAD8198738.1 unnamed protein product [Paramecium pentaurelia]
MNNNKTMKIKKSTEKGFDLESCFQKSETDHQDGYIKDADYYFDSYSHFSIHEEMLKDKIRTKAYQNAIIKNKQLFQNKIVLDVGAGTGILSIFAAQAGAKHVYAVENANIAIHAKKIISENGLSEKITIVKGKIEEIELPVEKVDIIISEWMGYFLLYESMLDCVLYARDKYLAPDGHMFPDKAIMYLSTIEDDEYRKSKIDFWDNVYGVNMSCIKQWALREPLVDCCNPEQINSNSCPIFEIDIKTVKVEDLDFSHQYMLKIQKDDYVHALVGWFDVQFSSCHVPVRLTTSPYAESTHWKQTVFYIEEPLAVKNNDIISGSIAVKKNAQNPRHLDIKISYHLENVYGKNEQIINYRLS